MYVSINPQLGYQRFLSILFQGANKVRSARVNANQVLPPSFGQCPSHIAEYFETCVNLGSIGSIGWWVSCIYSYLFIQALTGTQKTYHSYNWL